ncbi:MAG: fenitrothion hydrolase, partial [Solirubrobacterales bacterium]
MLGSLPVRIACGALGIFLLGVAIWAGFEGTSAPDRNIALTLIFVTSWLGFPLFSVALGNVFSAFNPWKAIATPVSFVYRKLAGREPVHLAYPAKLGRWPAVVGLAAFVWFELIYGTGGGVSVGVEPEPLAWVATFYTAYTLIMVGIFGREKWFENGEVFSVYFGMFGSLGKFEFRDGKLGIRRFLAGSTGWVTSAGSVAVVITSIGTTTFDGAQEGVFNGGIEQAVEWFSNIGLGATASTRLGSTAFMAISIGLVALVYLIGVRGMSTVPGAPGRWTLWRGFGHVLIPIAFAY